MHAVPQVPRRDRRAVAGRPRRARCGGSLGALLFGAILDYLQAERVVGDALPGRDAINPVEPHRGDPGPDHRRLAFGMDDAPEADLIGVRLAPEAAVMRTGEMLGDPLQPDYGARAELAARTLRIARVDQRLVDVARALVGQHVDEALILVPAGRRIPLAGAHIEPERRLGCGLLERA